MCFSQFAQYAPRPVYHYEPPARPDDAPPTKAELDDNLYGPKPLPPQWQQPAVQENGHSHEHTHVGNGAAAPAVTPVAVAPVAAAPVAAATPAATVVATNGSTAIASVSTQTVEAVVVELANGTRLLICPL